MIKQLFIASLSALLVLPVFARKQEIKDFRIVGPYAITTPIMIDSTDVNAKKYNCDDILSSAVNFDAVKNGSDWTGVELPGTENGKAVYMLGFAIQNRSYFKGDLKFEKAPKNYQLYIDGKKAASNSLSLMPGSHEAVIKYLADSEAKDSLQLSLETADSVADDIVEIKNAGDENGMYTIYKMMECWKYNKLSVSPNGKYIILGYSQRAPKQSTRKTKIIEIASGHVVGDVEGAEWMPTSNKYYYTRHDRVLGRQLVTVDPATGVSEVLANNMPDGYFSVSPTEDYLIISTWEEGPKELNKDVFEILAPDDRQPGWRTRSSVSKYDLKTGMLEPLTFGFHNVYLSDISNDGRYLLLTKSQERLTARPTTVFSLYVLDLQTMKVDTLAEKDGFYASNAEFSPDAKTVLAQGSPEAFNCIGMDVEAGQTPSMYDYQYYLIDIATKKINPVTKAFNPSVTGSQVWSKVDNQIYFTANNKDSVSLYRMNPADGKISMIQLPEENIESFDIASNATNFVFYGQSAMNSDRLYQFDTKTLNGKKFAPKLIEDLSAQTLDGIQVAECTPWTFKNSIGDDILCRYYTPVDFKEGKQYPMIVYYYGGCSPTERSFESSYPWQCWAGLGYVVLVVQPSGCAGFGQKFSARHVNTAGEDPARDIIEATKNFCASHSFVNFKRIGCCGASYGGFMTQYLQTVTDIFACAISHAGISDHTTYWGYGYWGYSYSEVSMANSYPWSETDLYVKHSPIYNVDKIHTPILFLHGTADTNVPYNNSVQMFNALKLLGRETAFVSIEGENHGIAEYDKRIAWLNTSLAWFQKYLKDDDSWWEALYPKKNL